MPSIRKLFSLLCSYVVGFFVFLCLQTLWNNPGKLNELVSVGSSTSYPIWLIIFAVLGLLLFLYIFIVGLFHVFKDFKKSSSLLKPSSNSDYKGGGSNPVDVSVHPTDTTVAAGGQALVSPHYNVSLLNLGDVDRVQKSLYPQMNPGAQYMSRLQPSAPPENVVTVGPAEYNRSFPQ